jgi:hypothetical protein
MKSPWAVRAAELDCEAVHDLDTVAAFNVAEAGLGATFAVLVALLGHRVRGLTPRLQASLAVGFLAFGVSDLIEVSTGAWWRPPDLLAYKAVCLVGIAVTSLLLWRNRRPGRRT